MNGPAECSDGDHSLTAKRDGGANQLTIASLAKAGGAVYRCLHKDPSRRE
jgi:hypothetical protein